MVSFFVRQPTVDQLPHLPQTYPEIPEYVPEYFLKQATVHILICRAMAGFLAKTTKFPAVIARKQPPKVGTVLTRATFDSAFASFLDHFLGMNTVVDFHSVFDDLATDLFWWIENTLLWGGKNPLKFTWGILELQNSEIRGYPISFVRARDFVSEEEKRLQSQVKNIVERLGAELTVRRALEDIKNLITISDSTVANQVGPEIWAKLRLD